MQLLKEKFLSDKDRKKFVDLFDFGDIFKFYADILEADISQEYLHAPNKEEYLDELQKTTNLVCLNTNSYSESARMAAQIRCEVYSRFLYAKRPRA